MVCSVAGVGVDGIREEKEGGGGGRVADPNIEFFMGYLSFSSRGSPKTFSASRPISSLSCCIELASLPLMSR